MIGRCLGFNVCPVCGYSEEVPEFSTVVIDKQHRHFEYGSIYLIDFVFVPKTEIKSPFEKEARA